MTSAAGRTVPRARRLPGLLLVAVVLWGSVASFGTVMSVLWSVHVLLCVVFAVPLAALLIWLALRICCTTAAQPPRDREFRSRTAAVSVVRHANQR